MSSSDEKCKGTKRPASPDEVCDFHHHVFLNWITSRSGILVYQKC